VEIKGAALTTHVVTIGNRVRALLGGGVADRRLRPVRENVDVDLIASVFNGLVASFALYTGIYNYALLLSWSLAATMLIWVVLSAVAVMIWRRAEIRKIATSLSAMSQRAHDSFILSLTGLASITALISLLVNKFNEDDSFYMSRAVLDWENWRDSIVVDYPFAFTNGAGGVFTSLPSFEHFLAGIAALTGLHPLDIYYFVSPTIFGFLLPFAWFLCLHRIGLGTRGAFFGTAFIVMLMLLDGTTMRGTANFSFFRIWQGKVILTGVLTPLAITASLDAVEWGRPRQWANLLLLGVAGLGLSTTAAFFLPILVGAAGFTWWLTMMRAAPIWRAPLGALIVFAYPALCILPLYLTVAHSEMILASPFAFNLADMVQLVYGAPPSLTLLAALAGAAGLLAARRLRLLLWVAFWTTAIVLPLAWPFTANLIVRYGTSSDALWRLAYASPVILTVGLGLGSCCEIPRLRIASNIALPACIAITGVLGLLHVGFSPFAAKDVIFPSLAYKMPSARLVVVREMANRLPAGTMLAPETLSVILPEVTGKFRLTNFRASDAPLQLVLDGRPADGDALLKAFEYVSGVSSDTDHLDQFKRVIGWGVDYVALGPEMRDRRDATTALVKAGYQELKVGVTPYQIFHHTLSYP
jgi:Family of unknown function (DUF6077)